MLLLHSQFNPRIKHAVFQIFVLVPFRYFSFSQVSTKARLDIGVQLVPPIWLQTRTAVTHSEVIWLKDEALFLHKKSALVIHLHLRCRI